jgi:hypothetical protein
MGLNNEDIKQLIAILQRGLAQEDAEQENTAKPKKKKSSQKTNNNIAKIKEEPSGRLNKFLDMPESRMHKEDSAIDKLLTKQPPVIRNRDYTPVVAVCRVCGKKESVHPGLVTEGAARYKCNRCATSEG